MERYGTLPLVSFSVVPSETKRVHANKARPVFCKQDPSKSMPLDMNRLGLALDCAKAYELAQPLCNFSEEDTGSLPQTGLACRRLGFIRFKAHGLSKLARL